MIQYEFKGKTATSGYNTATPLIATNILPETPDKSKAFYRRWVIVNFPNEFEEKRDIISEIPDEEYENFCSQVPKLLNNLLEAGAFCNEGTIAEKEEQYTEKSSPISEWIKECCVLKDGVKTPFSELFGEYTSWLKLKGFDSSISAHLMGKLLNNQGIKTSNSQGVSYRVGIKRVAWNG
jgi:putative DNA primase/helicase